MGLATCRTLRPSRSIDQAHAHVEPASNGILEHLVERRPLILNLGPADAGVLVGLDNFPAAMPGNPGQRRTLILGGLAVSCADPQLECRPHGVPRNVPWSEYPAYAGVK